MAAKKKNSSVGDKVKSILKNTAKQTGKDLLMLGTIVGPGKAVKGASMVAKARAGQQVSSKVAKKVGDKISGTTSKKVQGKLHKIAIKDAEQTARLNKDLDGYGSYAWSKHPAMVSGKGFDRSVNKGKTVTDRQSVRYRKAEDKSAAKANARGLKAANKPTSKNNRAVGPKTSTYVSDTLKNMKPANPKVTRGGSSKSKLNWPKSK